MARRASWSSGDQADVQPVYFARRAPECGEKCQPCVFFASRKGCAALACGFCHVHLKRTSRRPAKPVRDAFKRQAQEAMSLQARGDI